LRECQAVGLRPAPCRGVVKWWVKDSWVSARLRKRRSKSPAEAVDGVARVVGGKKDFGAVDPAPPPHQEVAADVIQREILMPDPADQHVLDRRRAGRARMHRDEGVLAQDQGIEAGVGEELRVLLVHT
jgi:hypothetical protein